MDFSSIPRALESLHRRQPSLSVATLTVADELLQVVVVGASSTTTTTAAAAAAGTSTTTIPETTLTKSVLQLLQDLLYNTTEEKKNEDDKERWEPLAVGLYIATEIVVLDGETSADVTGSSSSSSSSTACGENTSSAAVYMDGPRVPIIKDHHHPSTGTTIHTSDATSTTPTPTNTVGQQLRQLFFSKSDIVTLVRDMHTLCVQHLEHTEPRVRTLVAKAVGAYSTQILHFSTDEKDTAAVGDDLRSLLQEMYDMLCHSIGHHIQVGRDETTSTTAASTSTSTTTMSRASTGAIDDTTGWRAIETNWLCLASFVHALGEHYYTQFPISPTLYENCSYSSITHVNRHVRAAAMQTLEQWIHVITLSIVKKTNNNDDENKDDLKLLLSEPTSPLRQTVVDIVKTGLADNWSQVRMASSVVCRVWFQSLQALHISIQESTMLAALLPRMCLNRFYLAQGVKLYSHETWKLIFGTSSSSLPSSSEDPNNNENSTSTGLGLQLVVANIPAMIRYYIKMCDADNHAVREAACQAIAELAVRVGTHDQYRTKLDAQQIQNLIAALLMCFYDESWPVRDEACLACGILCKAFPQACHAEIFHKSLWERFTEQLTDQIWSVRENAAIAIGDVLEAYGEEILPKVQSLIQKLLPSAKEQPAMSAMEYKDHVNDLNQHTDNQLYSCGSLAPKLRKGGAGRIGCTNCGIDRPKAPWEATDGCIYLIREYVVRRTVGVVEGTTTLPPISDDELIPLLTKLADVCRVQHFPQSDDIRATLWKSVPIIAVAIGKQRFKNRYVDIFLDLLFRNLESSSASQLSHHAAGQCAEELATLIGTNLFRARLDDQQRQCYDRIVQERQMMPKGPAGGTDIFSPFGPPGLLPIVDIVPP
jgi:hypothetical protein